MNDLSGVFVIDIHEDIARKLRKHCNTLYTLGSGTMALGVWSAVQIILIVMNTPEVIFPQEFQENISNSVYVIIMLVVTVVMILLSMGLYVFTGSRARAEGMGKKRRSFYIVVVAFLIIVHAVTAVFSVINLFTFNDNQESFTSIIVSIIVNATSIYILSDMIYSAVMIRILRRNAETGKE